MIFSIVQRKNEFKAMEDHMSKMSELAASDEFIHKQKEVVDRLDTLVRDCTSFLDLKENWDSYGGATF